MAGSYVGLDIGSNLMKVAEVRRGGAGVEVTALGLAPTPPEAFENSVIIDPNLLGQAVKKLLKDAGISTNKVISSVSGQSAVVVRVIDVPQMNDAELAETMKWEVERHVPFATNEVIMDYVPIDRPEGYPEGQNMDVLLAVAQQDMIDRHVEMLQAAGLKPVAIDVEPLATGRTLLDASSTQTQPGHTVAIINIGASNTDVGIFRDKLIAFPRSLQIAGDALTRAIADNLHVDLATAEEYKRSVGEVIIDESQQAVGWAQPTAGGWGGGGFAAPAGEGFVDFSQQDPFANLVDPAGGATPTAPEPSSGRMAPSSPSGRMPFDFSTPGETPPPTPAATPFDLAGQPAPFDTPQASPDPFGAPPTDQASTMPGETTLGGHFGEAPTAQQNLPVPAATVVDPNADYLRQQVFGAVAPLLAELSQEIRRSLDYYRGRAADPTIHEVLLTGGSAKLKNLDKFLEMELGIPTRVADVLQTIKITSKNYSQGHLEEIASLFPISIGLGARDLLAPAGSAKKKPAPKAKKKK